MSSKEETKTEEEMNRELKLKPQSTGINLEISQNPDMKESSESSIDFTERLEQMFQSIQLSMSQNLDQFRQEFGIKKLGVSLLEDGEFRKGINSLQKPDINKHLNGVNNKIDKSADKITHLEVRLGIEEENALNLNDNLKKIKCEIDKQSSEIKYLERKVDKINVQGQCDKTSNQGVTYNFDQSLFGSYVQDLNLSFNSQKLKKFKGDEIKILGTSIKRVKIYTRKQIRRMQGRKIKIKRKLKFIKFSKINQIIRTKIKFKVKSLKMYSKEEVLADLEISQVKDKLDEQQQNLFSSQVKDKEDQLDNLGYFIKTNFEYFDINNSDKNSKFIRLIIFCKLVSCTRKVAGKEWLCVILKWAYRRVRWKQFCK